jgi:Ca2+-binding RTX toxin-like protein
MEGNSGKDTMFGGNGNDTMHGDGATDSMDGGNGNDAMSGGDANDTMSGGAGFDCMKGDAGNDQMWGDVVSDGAATIFGVSDTMLGGDGADTMNGQGGNDQMDGGNGKDVMNGGTGDDLMTGGSGDDTLTGGTGADTFAFRQLEVDGATDTDVITDWDPDDKILLCGQIAPFFTVEKVEIGIFDGFANLTNDVRIGLSNGQFILLLDAGDSGDWTATHTDAEAANADNFLRVASCPIDCEVPDCVD